MRSASCDGNVSLSLCVVSRVVTWTSAGCMPARWPLPTYAGIFYRPGRDAYTAVWRGREVGAAKVHVHGQEGACAGPAFDIPYHRVVFCRDCAVEDRFSSSAFFRLSVTLACVVAHGPCDWRQDAVFVRRDLTTFLFCIAMSRSVGFITHVTMSLPSAH